MSVVKGWWFPASHSGGGTITVVDKQGILGVCFVQIIEGEGSRWAWSLAGLMTEMPTGDAQGLGFAPKDFWE